MRKFLADKYGKSNITGFDLVVYTLENYKYKVSKTIELYEDLGKKFNMTPSNVERLMRYYKDSVGVKDKSNSEFLNDLLIELESIEGGAK